MQKWSCTHIENCPTGSKATEFQKFWSTYLTASCIDDKCLVCRVFAQILADYSAVKFTQTIPLS